jgi:hypothetical protein
MLFRRYSGAIQALFRLFFGSIELVQEQEEELLM